MNENMNEVVIKDVGGDIVKKAVQIAQLIRDDESLKIAKETFNRLSAFHKAAKAYLEPKKKKSYEAYKEISNMVTEHLTPLENAKKTLADAMGNFEFEQRQIAAEKEAEARAEAEAKLAAIKKENPEIADLMPAVVPAAALPARETVVTTVVTWHAEVLNKMDLMRAVVEGAVPLEAVSVELPYFNKLAQMKKMEGPICAGVVAVRKVTSR